MSSGPSQTPNQDDPLLEEDEVWSLLNTSPPEQASPFFSRNVLRSLRKSEAQAPQTTPSPFVWLRFAFPAIIALLILLGLFSGVTQPLTPESRTAEVVSDNSSIAQVEAAFEEELLAAAADYPELFSDDELVALLF